MLKPEYKIIYDRKKKDYIIQIYNSPNIGWSVLTIKSTEQKALDWIAGIK